MFFLAAIPFIPAAITLIEATIVVATAYVAVEGAKVLGNTVGKIYNSMSASDQEAEKADNEQDTTKACASCTTASSGNPDPDEEPPEEENFEQDGKDAKRISNNGEADRIAQNNGYRDAHDLKKVHNLDSKSDLFVVRNGKNYVGPKSGNGAREWLGIYKDGS